LENLSPGGQGLLEYTLILLLIALAIIVTFVVMGPQVGAVVSNVSKVLGQ
jgi:Flp pilus assembly pilin Flp